MIDPYDLRKAARQLDSVFKLLCTFEPLRTRSDVTWQGPYYIERPGRWGASWFVLYAGTLHVSLEHRGRINSVSWPIGAKEVKREYGAGYAKEPVPWVAVFNQIEKRLLSAQRNPGAYNRRVAKFIPMTCRQGKITRKYLWGNNHTPAVRQDVLQRTEQFIKEHAGAGYTQMTLGHYLQTAAIAYDAVRSDGQGIAAIERYRKRADGRSAGLLELPVDDARKFLEWYESSERLGAHPWEIIYGNPHGVMLPVSKDEKSGLWQYHLWAGGVGWYGAVAKIAAAFVEQDIIFQIVNHEAVLSALRGEDEVEVSPLFDFESVCVAELQETAPEVLKHIRWEALNELNPITQAQRLRIEEALRQAP